jgi:hypothetical protein
MIGFLEADLSALHFVAPPIHKKKNTHPLFKAGVDMKQKRVKKA